MICDTEGLLLCCNNCPATYHLNCLSSPLETAPEGDWQCPNCSNKELGDSPNEPANPNTTSPAMDVWFRFSALSTLTIQVGLSNFKALNGKVRSNQWKPVMPLCRQASAQLLVTQNSAPSCTLDRTFGGAWSEEELDSLWRGV
ncbi:hypothetical protein SLEP1_g55125 [Rubroshorea leprosula]|uniref:PHD-type domain-containing protein n=1 Tax=Rubroshorea leprosula TaxID=152421 RepID=A0AAV5MEM2_9ROSI|nr:hypothetical protein SLEP1_g55125 [Rubroshorea leprosula]